MAKLLPSSSDIPPPSDAGPRVVGLDSDDADAVIGALKSETARKLLTALHEQPDSASALADRIDTSLQNVQYHLANLEEADLIEVVDTVYSEKGREMDVYAPADEPLVLFGSSEPETDGLRAAIARLLGGIGVLGVGSLAVQGLAESWGLDDTPEDAAEPMVGTPDDEAEAFEIAEEEPDDADEPADDVEDDEPMDDEPVEDDVDEAEEPPEEEAELDREMEPAADEVEDAAPSEELIEWLPEFFDPLFALEPGVVFFLGGLVVLVTIVAIQYVQQRRAGRR